MHKTSKMGAVYIGLLYRVPSTSHIRLQFISGFFIPIRDLVLAHTPSFILHLYISVNHIRYSLVGFHLIAKGPSFLSFISIITLLPRYH